MYGVRVRVEEMEVKWLVIGWIAGSVVGPVVEG